MNSKRKLTRIKLIGLSLPYKTTNANGQSGKDCGKLWQQFETADYANKIPNKTGNEIIAVYHQYEGDHTQAFSYFIGCPVAENTETPPGMATLIIPTGNYIKFVASGPIPDCIGNTWKQIWDSDIPRTYQADFEIYDERSKNWKDGQVDIYIGIQS